MDYIDWQPLPPSWGEIERHRRTVAKRGYVPKANKYAGTCNCGQHVKAGEGAIYRVNGKWHVACQQHKAVALY